MQKKKLSPIVAVLMLAIMTVSMIPVNAWVYYNDTTGDAKWEDFGPRADRLLISLYADDTGEWDALKAGDIDMTDWPLSKTVYEELTSSPYNTSINVVNYGAEFGLFILDMNSNNNEFLGNPEDTDYPNPKYPNPMSNVALRRAIAHLIDRDGLIADPTLGAGFAAPMYTAMPVALASYVLDVPGDLTIPWAWNFSTQAAADLLDAAGIVDNGDADTWRNDPVTGNNLFLDFVIRTDHPGRKMIGETLVALMEADPINIEVDESFRTSGEAFVKVMVNKDFHMYTGGWGLGVDPDHLILWSWNWYWHPGFAYNYGGHNDAAFNDAADGIMFANTEEEALTQALIAQYRQAYMVLAVPLYAVSGNKAYSRTYVGPTGAPGAEASYIGQNWEGVVNVMGYGIDQGTTFVNMHPAGNETGNGDMTIRWGYKVPDIKQLNPIYSSWLYDWNVLDKIYGSLLGRNDSDLGQFLPSLAESYSVDTYEHPTLGTNSRISFTLRPDVTWSDGTPLTVADVFFTFVELKQILSSRGFPNPWWYSNVMNILSFSIKDAYNFEVLLDVKSVWAQGWIGGNVVLPKHIWKPIAETLDPQAFQPDPDLIGSGPWRFDEYVETSHVLMIANKPGSVVHSITSPNGYALNEPVHYQETLIDGSGQRKFDAATVSLDQTYANAHLGSSKTVDIDTATLGSTTSYVSQAIAAGDTFTHSESPTFPYGLNSTETTIAPGRTSTVMYWVTINEDIGGSTFYDDIGESGYAFKSQLPTPDFKVDILDIALAALAFGSNPGHARWNTVADINGDFRIDIFDIASIALKFGWTG